MMATDTLKKFVVVRFEKDDHFAVIPSTWLSEDITHCAWPGPKVRNPTQLQLDPASIPDKNFKYYKVDVHKSYGKPEYFFILQILT